MDAAEKKRRNRRVRMMRRALWVVLAVWFVLGLIGLFTVCRWIVQAATGAGKIATGTEWAQASNGKGQEAGEDSFPSGTGKAAGEDSSRNGAGQPGAAYPFSEEEREEARRLYGEHPELLVLVNKEQALDESFDPELRSICGGRLQASDWMYDDLVAMLAAASDEGYGYWIASAYRSRERQQELIDEDVAAFMEKGMSYEEALEKTLTETMPAGHSEHETGLALDILCSGNENMDISQAAEPGNTWLVAHCAEYGFILRYPADKEAVTGIACEPWHFRYVGREAAQFIMGRGIALEEFFIILSN